MASSLTKILLLALIFSVEGRYGQPRYGQVDFGAAMGQGTTLVTQTVTVVHTLTIGRTTDVVRTHTLTVGETVRQRATEYVQNPIPARIVTSIVTVTSNLLVPVTVTECVNADVTLPVGSTNFVRHTVTANFPQTVTHFASDIVVQTVPLERTTSLTQSRVAYTTNIVTVTVTNSQPRYGGYQY